MAKKPVLNQDLKESAHAMVGFGFWKHLERFMQDMERESIEKQDSVSLTKAMTDHYFCEARATRNVLKKIREEVEQYTL